MQHLLAELAWILAFVAKAFLHILPYLAVSLPLAVYLKRSGLSKKIEGTLKGNEAVAVLVATLVGALSPFCSCGVIPIIAALLTGGAPLAPVMAFWLASPSMDPEIFFLSVGSLGWELAVWRLAATFAMSLGAGYATLALERSGFIGGDILRGARGAKRASDRRAAGTAPLGGESGEAGVRPRFRPLAGAGAAAAFTDAAFPSPALATARSCGCGSAPAAEARPSGRGETPGAAAKACGCAPSGLEGGVAGLAADALDVVKRLAFFMGLAFLMEALISRYLPAGLVARLLGGKSPFAVPLAALVGVPFYTTGASALGIAAGLLERGMSSPAALAFLVGGAVTTLPAMSAVFGIVRPRVFALYLGFSAAGALLSGYAMQIANAVF